MEFPAVKRGACAAVGNPVRAHLECALWAPLTAWQGEGAASVLAGVGLCSLTPSIRSWPSLAFNS